MDKIDKDSLFYICAILDNKKCINSLRCVNRHYHDSLLKIFSVFIERRTFDLSHIIIDTVVIDHKYLNYTPIFHMPTILCKPVTIMSIYRYERLIRITRLWNYKAWNYRIWSYSLSKTQYVIVKGNRAKYIITESAHSVIRIRSTRTWLDVVIFINNYHDKQQRRDMLEYPELSSKFLELHILSKRKVLGDVLTDERFASFINEIVT